MSDINSWRSRISLVIGHMSGMIDLAALPIWVGILISGYAFAPAQAGGLATLFLLGVVVSSVLLSPVFHRVPGRWMPATGFGISALAFYAMTQLSAFVPLAIGHFVAGMATGLALSFTHGTMGRTGSPHRIFAMGNLMLGIFAMVFLGSSPVLIAKFGPATIFRIFAVVMGIACATSAALFPAVAANEDVRKDTSSLSRPVWLVLIATTSMALVQAMTFSFVERMGADRGLTPEQIQGVLIVLGLIAITPALPAALLEKRLPPIGVAVTGATLQGLVAALIACSNTFAPYAVGAVAFPCIMIFTHTFVFGHLAKLDPTGRAVAATPAILMSGSMVGPLLGGVLVQGIGYPAIGIAALLIDFLAIALFVLSVRKARIGHPSPVDARA